MKTFSEYINEGKIDKAKAEIDKHIKSYEKEKFKPSKEEIVGKATDIAKKFKVNPVDLSTYAKERAGY
jgi:hypothetical protein